MISNLILYRLRGFDFDLPTMESALSNQPFVPCGANQEKTSGWAPARGQDNGAMVEAIGGHWIAKFFTESKSVPGSVLARKVDELAARIEREVGRKPGRKERRELKEQVKQDLLPMAHTKQSCTFVWIDPRAMLLVVGSASQGRADEIVSLLVKELEGLSLGLVDTNKSPTACMAHWLVEQEPPTGFSIDRECELKSPDESKAVVRYTRHPLDIEEVQLHIRTGKLPTKLAMSWEDRVSFLLTEGLQLRRVNFLDTLIEGQSQDADAFDTNVAITTGELSKLIPNLLAALGGEATPLKPQGNE